MKRNIILLALSVCACTKPDIPSTESFDNIQSYGTEDIIILKKNGNKLYRGENTFFSPWKDDTLTVYPYPNTSAPIAVESTDSTRMIPTLLDRNTLFIDCMAPGRAGLIVTCEDVSRTWNIMVERKVHYDLRYDPSADRLTLNFTQDPSYPIEEKFWEQLRSYFHITTIWSYKVGYGSAYMNTRYPRTTTTSGEFSLHEGIFLENLEKEYKIIKELFDEELAREYEKDPKHAWSSWSGIELKTVIRNPENCLIISHNKGIDSAYGYNLGFTLSHTVIKK